jgi:hypothetical protein
LHLLFHLWCFSRRIMQITLRFNSISRLIDKWSEIQLFRRRGFIRLCFSLIFLGWMVNRTSHPTKQTLLPQLLLNPLRISRHPQRIIWKL